MTMRPAFSRNLGFMAAVIRALPLSALPLLLTGCSDRDNGCEEQVVRWTDPQSNVILVVAVRREMAKNISLLRIHDPEAAGASAEKMMDDDVLLGTVRLIQFSDWIIVTNGSYALGGYDRKNHRIAGEYEWTELPFRKWEGQGKVLLTRKHVQTSDATGTPAGYPSD